MDLKNEFIFDFPHPMPNFDRAKQWPPAIPPQWICPHQDSIKKLAEITWPYSAPTTPNTPPQLNKGNCVKLFNHLHRELIARDISPMHGFYYLSAIYALLTDQRVYNAQSKVSVPGLWIMYAFRLYLNRMKPACLRGEGKMPKVDAEMMYVKEIIKILCKPKGDAKYTFPISTFDEIDYWHNELGLVIDDMTFTTEKKRKVADPAQRRKDKDEKEKDDDPFVIAPLSTHGKFMEKLVRSWIKLISLFVKAHCETENVLFRMFGDQMKLIILRDRLKIVCKNMRADDLEKALTTLFDSTIDSPDEWNRRTTDKQVGDSKSVARRLQTIHTDQWNKWKSECVKRKLFDVVNEGGSEVNEARTVTQTDQQHQPVTVPSAVDDDDDVIILPLSKKRRLIQMEEDEGDSCIQSAKSEQPKCDKEDMDGCQSDPCPLKLDWTRVHPVHKFPYDIDGFLNALKLEIGIDGRLIWHPEWIPHCLRLIERLHRCSPLPPRVQPPAIHCISYEYRPEIWHYLITVLWNEVIHPTSSGIKCQKLLENMVQDSYRFPYRPVYLEGAWPLRGCVKVLQSIQEPTEAQRCCIRFGLDIALRVMCMDLFRKSRRQGQYDWKMIDVADLKLDDHRGSDKFDTVVNSRHFRWSRYSCSNAQMNLIHKWITTTTTSNTDLEWYSVWTSLFESIIDYDAAQSAYWDKIYQYNIPTVYKQYYYTVPVVGMDPTSCKYHRNVDEKSHTATEYVECRVYLDDGQVRQLCMSFEQWEQSVKKCQQLYDYFTSNKNSCQNTDGCQNNNSCQDNVKNNDSCQWFQFGRPNIDCLTDTCAMQQ